MPFPNLLASKPGRLVAFFFLYVTEGIPLGFTATAIATQMRRQGVSPTEIGAFVGTLYLPWAWKWLMGPVVDVVYSDRLGRRRGWIVAMQVLMSTLILASIPINFSTELWLFTTMVLVINICAATQDVAIDALAVTTLPEEERGVANGLMFAGAYVGNALGGSCVLFMTAYFPFRFAYIYVAACILAVTVFIALPLREAKTVRPERGEHDIKQDVWERILGYLWQAGRAFFGTRAAIAGLGFAIFPAGAYSLSLALQSNLAVEMGLSDNQIGVLALVSAIISAVGCVAGGWLSDRFGRRRMLALYIACTAAPTLYLAYAMYAHGWIMPIDPRLPNRPIPAATLITAFWAANIVYAVFQGLMFGTRTALFMDITTAAVAATQFTAYMALLNLVTWYSATWQGLSIDTWGYPATLVLDALFGLIGLVFLPWMVRPAAEDSPAT